MSLSVDGFLKHLSDSRVLSAAELAAVESQIPAAKRAQDAQSLARELVRLKKLTPFQANVLYKEDPTPLILGNYLLQDKIGSGGMGMVYKAQHRRMKRVVAVKVLSATAIQSPNIVKRFLREAEAAAKLTHPNIVAAYDADEINGVPFLAMEYVDGTDLAIYVTNNGPMPFKQAMDCILQAAKGLEHAHQHGIVHRDIKPANLLLDGQGTVKILDMGLARIQDSNQALAVAEAAALTQQGFTVGTIDFMSPEQAIDSRQADASSDIYSLGATLFFLLTGKAMYDLPSLMSRLVAHRESPIPSICEVQEGVPLQIDLIFQRMVAKQKQDRFASMTDVVRDLENWQKVTESGPIGSSSVDAKKDFTVQNNVISAIFDDE